MHSWYLVDALAFIAAVVDPVTLSQPGIAAFRPRCAPFLYALRCIPVVVILFVALILLASCLVDLLEDLLSVLVQIVDLPAFRSPCSVRLDAPRGQHNMSMGIAVALIMQRPVCTHTLISQAFDKIADSLNLIGPAKLFRKCNLDLTPEPCVFCFFDLVHRAP